jgi:XTP/dITP diphosphohydrolase
VATANIKKFKEIKKILARLPLEVKCLLDFKARPRIVEDGKNFFENAKKKAEITSSFYNCLSLGEDSGLQVEALGGEPGIFSSRYAGKGADDKKNIAKLLGELHNVPKNKRLARFSCWAVLADRGKSIKRFQGRISGRITLEPKGRFGFGYDPVFFIPNLQKTLAQVPLSVKNKMSHRYKAISKVRRYLDIYLKKR